MNTLMRFLRCLRPLNIIYEDIQAKAKTSIDLYLSIGLKSFFIYFKKAHKLNVDQYLKA